MKWKKTKDTKVDGLRYITWEKAGWYIFVTQIKRGDWEVRGVRGWRDDKGYHTLAKNEKDALKGALDIKKQVDEKLCFIK